MYRNIMIAIVLALVLGLVFGDITWLQYPLKELGALFTSLLKMCVVPLAFASIAKAIIDLHNGQRISMHACGLMIGLSIIGVALGLGLTWMMGVPTFVVTATDTVAVQAPTVLSFINSCIPVNIVHSFATGNMLQIVTLAAMVGLIGRTSQYKDSIAHALGVIQYIFLNVAKYVMYIAPVGVFALLYPVVVKFGLGVLQSYLWMFGTLVIGIILFTLCVSLPVLYLYKVDGVSFLKTIFVEDIANSIAGGASNTIGNRMVLLKKDTDIPHAVIDYLTPIVSVLMRVGSCICVGVYVMYASAIFGVPLGSAAIVTVLLLTTVALMCAPGIIGGTLMDCAIIFAAVGIPLEAVTFLFATDYIMDLIRTVLNIQGGEVVTACAGKKYETIYNAGE